MYQDYDRAVSEVMEYLFRNNYSSSIVYMHKRCFRLFKKSLIENKVAYSRELAIDWLKDIGLGLCSSVLKNYRLALSRMDDILEDHEIANTKEKYEAVQYHKHLAPWCKKLLHSFLDELSVKHNAGHAQVICVSASRFLSYISTHGVESASGITHKVIRDYNRDDAHKNQRAKDRHNDRVRIFLRYLAKRKHVRASIPLVLDKFTLERLVFIDDIPANEKNLFDGDSQADCMMAEEFHSMAMRLSGSCLGKQRYSFTIRKNFKRVWNELFVFLESNDLQYSQDVALCWASFMRRHTTQWRIFRRSIMIFEQFRNNGDINPAIVYSYKKDKADDLPGWCREEYRDFIAEKRGEGFASSTIDMYRSSCLRFLEYLSKVGLASWKEVSPEILKDFHHSDPHSTSEAKNAYAAKIRIFLNSLGVKGLVPPSLYLALSNEHAPRINIIRTLGKDDISVIYDFLDHAESSIQLRDAAMIILGLRMGIRASDITNLKLSDISWDNATISMLQKKTAKFMKLPMPTEVGNCLYKYITRGRPSSTANYVFINHRVPYGRLHRKACSNALKRVLPTDPHGFHITRKTFASRMLVSSTKPETIAEALGHSDNSTVMAYLATDGESMRQCAISLECIGVKGGALS